MKQFMLLAALLSSAVIAQPFENVTTSVFDQVKKPNRGFWAGLPDINGDGCIDAFTGDHEDGGENYAWLQEKDSSGKCLGKFTSAEDNISRDARTRITSLFLWGNWRNDPRGLPSVMGLDLDSDPSAIYDPVPGMAAGGPLTYIKSVGCNGTRMTCIPVDIDGDGWLELATSSSVAPFGAGNIRNIGAAGIKYRVDAAPTQQTLIVLDVDNDTRPEVIAPGLGGYWKFINGAMTWQADKIVGGAPWASNHTVVADYDLDGDQDILIGYTPAPNTKPFTYGMVYWRNDNGNFVNDTVATKIPTLGFTAADYFTSYANAQAADFNNDGWVDVLTCGNAYSGVNANHLLMNSGGAVFSKNTSTNWGRYLPTDADDDKAFCGVGDTNNDGFVDIFKTHGISGPNHVGAAIFQNKGLNANKWLDFHVVGDPALKVSMDGLHTTILVRDVTTKQIVCSQQIGVFRPAYHNLRPHCGLGERATVDVEIRLPHGAGVYTFAAVPTGQRMTINARGVATYSVAGPVVLPPVEPEPEPEPEDPPAPSVDIEAVIEALQDAKAKVEEANGLIDGALKKLETPVVVPEDPEPPVPPAQPALGIVPFADNFVDNALVSFAETARRNWNFGGHTVPVPFATAEGFWEYDKQEEPWLFDRPSSWFMMYEMTGDPAYYDQAVFDLKEYAQHIDANGYFDLKKTEKDTKYLYLASFYRYQTVTPPAGRPAADIDQFDAVVERIWTASNAGYSTSTPITSMGFWTEREPAVHAETAYYYSMLTGKPEGFAKARAIVEHMRDGLQFVSYTVHEGGGPGGTLPQHAISSPWMMALYLQTTKQLLGNGYDELIYTQAANYGEWAATSFTTAGQVKTGMNAFVWGEDIHVELTGVLIPRYMTGPYYGDARPSEEHIHHGVDVLGAMQFSRFSMVKLGRDTAAIDQVIQQLRSADGAIDRSLKNMTRSTVTLPKYRIKPPRMWNWWIRGRYAFLQ